MVGYLAYRLNQETELFEMAEKSVKRVAYADGSWFEGCFIGNQRHGFGVYHSADGIAFAGQFRNDQRHGLGMLIDRKNNKIGGFWHHD